MTCRPRAVRLMAHCSHYSGRLLARPKCCMVVSGVGCWGRANRLLAAQPSDGPCGAAPSAAGGASASCSPKGTAGSSRGLQPTDPGRPPTPAPKGQQRCLLRRFCRPFEVGTGVRATAPGLKPPAESCPPLGSENTPHIRYSVRGRSGRGALCRPASPSPPRGEGERGGEGAAALPRLYPRPPLRTAERGKEAVRGPPRSPASTPSPLSAQRRGGKRG